MTITHDALRLIVQSPSLPALSLKHGTSLYRSPYRHETSLCSAPPTSNLSSISLDMEPHCTGTASDIWWPRLETCSNLFNPHSTTADIWWLLKQVQSAQASGTHPTGVVFCKYVDSIMQNTPYYVHSTADLNVSGTIICRFQMRIMLRFLFHLSIISHIFPLGEVTFPIIYSLCVPPV